MSEIHHVVCRNCGRAYDGFALSQADGCAATYKRGVVYGHYGSKHDVTTIRVPLANVALELAQSEEVLDPVCDACIDAWIAAGGTESQEWCDFNQPGAVRMASLMICATVAFLL